MNTEPKTVERLREMMEGAAPQNRAESTVLRLRTKVRLLDNIAAAGYHVVRDGHAVHDGVICDLEPSLGHEGYFLLKPEETP